MKVCLWCKETINISVFSCFITGAKLGIVTKTNANNGGSSGRLGSSGVGGGADGGTFGAINAYDSIDGSE